MNLIREHHHTLLVTLFLIGTLLVAGSFEARLPDSAIAATTPGQQSANESSQFVVDCTSPGCSLFAESISTVTYTGEVRRKDTGALLVSSDKLKPGDQVDLTVFMNGGYNNLGNWGDSPPMPWVDDIFIQQGVYVSNNNDEMAEMCADGAYRLYYGVGNMCYVVASEKPVSSLSANGLTCGPLTSVETSIGNREVKSTCTVNSPVTSPITATLALNIGESLFSPLSFSSEPLGNPGWWKMGKEVDDESGKIKGKVLPFTARSFSWNIDVEPNPPAAPSLTFTGAPTTIQQGQSATLTWSSQNTTSCTASGGWSGSKSTSGNENVTPPSTTTYTLNCTGAGGSVASVVTITVSNKPDLTAQSSGVAILQSGRKFSLISEALAQDLLAGIPLTFTGIIANLGGSAASPSETRLRIDVGNNGWTSGEPQFTASTGALAPAGVETETWQGAWTPTAGTHNFEVCADSGNVVSESNETNNCVSRTFTVSSGGFSCNAQGQCVFGGSGQGCQITNNCGGGVGGTCFGNCGGGDGGVGCTNPVLCPVIPITPTASQLGSDTGFFCPSHQVQLNWSYSDPNSDPQASFRLQVDDNSDFSSMKMDVYKDTADHLYITPADVLALGTKYYFRIAVKDSTEAWSNWSPTADFTAPANCVMPDFALNSSNSLTVNVTGVGTGSSNTTKITVTPFDQFASPVVLSFNSASPALSGAVYNLTPMTLSSGQYSSGSVFKVTVPGTTAPGNYIITINGVDGGLVRTVNVILHVNSTSPEFQEI